MKFTLDTGKGILIHAYRPGKITLKVPGDDPSHPYRQVSHRTSLILMNDDSVEEWPVREISELDSRHCDIVWQNNPGIVLLGTGQRLVFPQREIREAFALRGIGLEVMDTAAACRTYNVLIAEGRSTMAMLIIG